MKLRIRLFFDFIAIAFVMIVLAFPSLFYPVKTKDIFKKTVIDAVEKARINNAKVNF